MTKEINRTLVEAIYGFCCNDIEKLCDIKSFICREFLKLGLADDKELLSSEVDEAIQFLRENRLLKLEFFEGDEPCFVTTREFSELLGYTIEGVGI